MTLHIGENIKRLRREKGDTQEQLAAALHITPAAVSKWEREETLPDVTLLQPLAFYFGVSLDTLFGYDEERIRAEIDEKFTEYGRLYRTDARKARAWITDMYHAYPSDYRVMSAYMWNIAGDLADNDPAVLLSLEEELQGIAGKLLEGCTDESLRAGAWNMRAKLLHAHGHTEEALAIYRERMSNWYGTAEQKSEQLFAKDTSDFLWWVKRNAYELSSFGGDKLHKTVFFDRSLSYRERINRILRAAEGITRLREETGEFFFASMERSLWGRLLNDLLHREGEEADILYAVERVFQAGDTIEKMARETGVYSEEECVRLNGRRFWCEWLKHSLHARAAALRKSEAVQALLAQYDIER